MKIKKRFVPISNIYCIILVQGDVLKYELIALTFYRSYLSKKTIINDVVIS